MVLCQPQRSKCLYCISDSLNYSSYSSISRKKFLQLEIVEKLFEINYVTRRLNGLAMCSIENAILDIIDLDTIINDFASRNARRIFFVKNWNITVDGIMGLAIIWGNHTHLIFYFLVCIVDIVFQKLYIWLVLGYLFYYVKKII